MTYSAMAISAFSTALFFLSDNNFAAIRTDADSFLTYQEKFESFISMALLSFNVPERLINKFPRRFSNLIFDMMVCMYFSFICDVNFLKFKKQSYLLHAAMHWSTNL
jgi:hypothetical protein